MVSFPKKCDEIDHPHNFNAFQIDAMFHSLFYELFDVGCDVKQPYHHNHETNDSKNHPFFYDC